MGKIISLNMAIGEKKLLTERIEKLTRTIEIVKAKGKKAEAVAILKEAVANRVQGASELLKQVEAMK